jgi:hypothetical protein
MDVGHSGPALKFEMDTHHTDYAPRAEEMGMGKSCRLGNHPTQRMILHPLRPQHRRYLPPRYPGWVMSGDQAVERTQHTEMSDKVLRVSASLSWLGYERRPGGSRNDAAYRDIR